MEENKEQNISKMPDVLPSAIASSIYCTRASNVAFHMSVFCTVLSLISGLIVVISPLVYLVVLLFAILFVMCTLGLVLVANPGFFDGLSSGGGVMGSLFSFASWVWKIFAPIAIVTAIVCIVFSVLDKRATSKARYAVCGAMIASQAVIVLINLMV